MMIYGRQGTGKSTLLVQLAHSFQTGEPWMGFHVNQTGPTIMLQLDMPKGDLSKFIQRTCKEGLDLSGMAIYGAPEGFNIRMKADRALLKEECEKIQPIVVFVDTVNDSFGRSLEGNEHVRDVLHNLSRTIGNAALIYTNHTRKKGAYVQAMESKQGAAMDDPDAFSGFGAWEQVATSSIELRDHNDRYQLVLQKHRLDNPGFKEIDLVKNGNGFFRPESPHAQILLQWPHSIPPKDRERVMACSTSIRAACEEIGKLAGVKPEAVRQTYYRMKKRGASPLSQLEDDAR